MRPHDLSADAPRLTIQQRNGKRLVKWADKELTEAGIRHTERTLNPTRITGLPRGGVVVASGTKTEPTLTRAWQTSYMREVDRTINGYAVMLHPTRSRGDVVEMTWETFVHIALLLQGGDTT